MAKAPKIDARMARFVIEDLRRRRIPVDGLLKEVSLNKSDLASPEGRIPYAPVIHLIERAATDNRNFVKKGVSWALRSIGHRNAALHAASVATATRLAASADASARWIGKDALRDLMRAQVLKRVAERQ